MWLVLTLLSVSNVTGCEDEWLAVSARCASCSAVPFAGVLWLLSSVPFVAPIQIRTEQIYAYVPARALLQSIIGCGVKVCEGAIVGKRCVLGHNVRTSLLGALYLLNLCPGRYAPHSAASLLMRSSSEFVRRQMHAPGFALMCIVFCCVVSSLLDGRRCRRSAPHGHRGGGCGNFLSLHLLPQ